jgi:hypothetical protein
MDANTELVLKMIADLHTAMDSGFRRVHERLDILNGRTRKAEEAVAVLHERTADMVCVEHAERFRTLDRDATQLKRDVNRIQQDLVKFGGPIEAKPRKPITQLAITGTAAAAIMAILEGIWQWWSTR